MPPKKLLYFLSHPIQYHSPLFQLIAKQNYVDLTVCYYTDHTMGGTDKEFGKRIKWDIPLLEGYEHRFIKNYSFRPQVSGKFLGLINPGVIIQVLINKPDVVLVNGWAYFSDWLVFLVCKSVGVQVVVRGDSAYKHDCYNNSILGNFKKKLLNSLVSKFLFVGVQNRLYYQKFVSNSSERLFFAPHCVDNNRFQKEYKKLKGMRFAIKKTFGFLENDLIILCTGKYISKKRPFDLLRAFNNLSHDHIKLVMVGEGELRDQMESYIMKNNLSHDVMLTGFINQSKISRYYSIADIFVLPSGVNETWGLVLNEAMNFNLPLVVSDMVGASDDLVCDAENGFSYPCGDIDALTDTLITLITNESLRKSMGNKSAEIIKNYSYDRVLVGIKQAIA